MSALPDMPAKLVYQPVIGFVEQIAAKSPAPGGGSAAALSGAIGAALLMMVCEFSIGKKGFESVAGLLSDVKGQLDGLRHKLTVQVDEDTWAFSRFRVANRLPETTDEERAHKQREISEASAQTIEVPRQTMQMCCAALAHALTIVDKGNPNTVSDAATGAEMLLAGMDGAANNVLINIVDRDDDAARTLRSEVAEARQTARALLAAVRGAVAAKLRG